MSWTHGLLCAMFVAGATISAWRFFYAKTDIGISRETYTLARETDGAHIFMNLSMALMLTPWYGNALKWTLVLILAVVSAAFGILLWFTVNANRRQPFNAFSLKLGTYSYHLFTSLAMLYAVLTMSEMLPICGMAGMSMSPSRFNYFLSAVFLIDMLVTAVAVLWFPNSIVNAVAVGTPLMKNASPSQDGTVYNDASATETSRLAALPHIIMDIGMVWMLSLS